MLRFIATSAAWIAAWTLDCAQHFDRAHNASAILYVGPYPIVVSKSARRVDPMSLRRHRHRPNDCKRCPGCGRPGRDCWKNPCMYLDFVNLRASLGDVTALRNWKRQSWNEDEERAA